jgi:hypothetical protein
MGALADSLAIATGKITFGGGASLTEFEKTLVSAHEPDANTSYVLPVAPGMGGALRDFSLAASYAQPPIYASQNKSILFTGANALGVVGLTNLPPGPRHTEDFTCVYFYEREASVTLAGLGGVGWGDQLTTTNRMHTAYEHSSGLLYIIEGSSSKRAQLSITSWDSYWTLGTPYMVNFGRTGSTWSLGINGVEVASQVATPVSNPQDKPFFCGYAPGYYGPLYVFSRGPDYTALLDLYNSASPRTIL